MAHQHLTRRPDGTEGALTVLFCLVDDAYGLLNPEGARRYEGLKSLSDSEVITLALFQQLRGTESEHSFLRDAARFFAHLFPGVVGLHPSSFNRRLRKLGRFLEPLRRAVLPELVGDPETLIVDSTLLPVLHPRQPKRSAGWGSPSSGAAWARWGTFAVYGVKLHLLCATNRVPVSYELTPANAAEVRLVGELLAEAEILFADGAARKLLGDLAYRGEELREALAGCGVLLWRPSGPTGGRRSGSRWRSASRPSSGSWGSGRRWRRRWRGWGPGSRPRSPLTPTPSASIASWAGRRGASRTCGPRNHALHI